MAGLLRDQAGSIYGTTYYGGFYNDGTVYQLDQEGKQTVLHSFTGRSGSNSRAGLIQDPVGNLYGTTQYGGANGYGLDGTVLKLDTAGNETVLYGFTGESDGGQPYAGLIQDAEGNLYGTTARDGAYNDGTVFKIDASGTHTVLYSFAGGADGAWPVSSLIRDDAGNLFGTTAYGGLSCYAVYGCGTVFKLTPSGSESVLYRFTGGADGALAQGGLIRDAAGNLYGTTFGGGAYGFGTVFKLDTTGTETVLHNFTGGVDGKNPAAGLIRDAVGNFYGTTPSGGVYGYGTVFKLDVTGTETVLHSFNGADGATSQAGLIVDAAGNLYGTTVGGGAYGYGTVFKLHP